MPAANLVVTLDGSEPDLPFLACGSHLDSVPQGGNYDGGAGVVAGLAVLAGFQARAGFGRGAPSNCSGCAAKKAPVRQGLYGLERAVRPV
jgi:hypothetical protein